MITALRIRLYDCTFNEMIIAVSARHTTSGNGSLVFFFYFFSSSSYRSLFQSRFLQPFFFGKRKIFILTTIQLKSIDCTRRQFETNLTVVSDGQETNFLSIPS